MVIVFMILQIIVAIITLVTIVSIVFIPLLIFSEYAMGRSKFDGVCQTCKKGRYIIEDEKTIDGSYKYKCDNCNCHFVSSFKFEK